MALRPARWRARNSSSARATSARIRPRLARPSPAGSVAMLLEGRPRRRVLAAAVLLTRDERGPVPFETVAYVHASRCRRRDPGPACRRAAVVLVRVHAAED